MRRRQSLLPPKSQLCNRIKLVLLYILRRSIDRCIPKVIFPMLFTRSLNLDELPAILAGPILRRLTRNTIAVWGAFSLESEVTLHVGVAGQPSNEEQVTVQPTRVGVNLWIAVLELQAGGSIGSEFSAGEIYEYGLSSSGWPAERAPQWVSQSPSDPGFTYLSGAQIAQLPTFQGLPNSWTDLQIVQTSCRKPHGLGRDGLRLIDDLIIGGLGGGSVRPHQLILSGDQVYADDVAAPLLPQIRRIATQIVSIEEDDLFTNLDLVDGRQSASESFGLTSGAASNHVFTLAEFYALYLLSWSDTLWPEELPKWNDLQESDLSAESTLDEASWNEQLRRLNEFRQSLPFVRRMLANCPTLMIFDDHEVTDDWNLSHGWASEVYTNSSGSRVLFNGLLAYLLFQHWGNQPAPFQQVGTPENQLLTEAVWTPTSASPDREELRAALGMPAAIGDAPFALREFSNESSVRYDLQLKEADGYPINLTILDERTAREFRIANGPPSRVSDTALAEMIPDPVSDSEIPLLVVAPGPVLGLRLIEHQLQPAIALLPGGETTVDLESWTAYGPSFETLLDRFSLFPRVVVLSGDVHFGYAKRMEYEKPPGGPSNTIIQFTASSAKNGDSLTMALHMFGDLMQKLGIVRPRSHHGYSQLSSEQQNLLSSPPPDGTVLPWDDTVDILLGRVLREGINQPAIIDKEVADSYALGNPDWTYTIEHFDDESLPSSIDLVALEEAASLEWSEWIPANSLQMIRGLRASDRNRIGRVFTGLPQMMLLQFDSNTSVAIGEFFMPIGEVRNGGANESKTKVVIPL